MIRKKAAATVIAAALVFKLLVVHATDEQLNYSAPIGVLDGLESVLTM